MRLPLKMGPTPICIGAEAPPAALPSLESVEPHDRRPIVAGLAIEVWDLHLALVYIELRTLPRRADLGRTFDIMSVTAGIAS